MSAVLVIGASGTTGSEVLRLLRAAGAPVRAASRAPRATDVVRFEWDDVATHGRALDGVDRVYLVPPPSAVDPLPVVEPFLEAARRRGVHRLVMLGSAIEFPNAPGRLELAARVAAEPGWLVLSPSGFMQNFLRPHPLGTAIHDTGTIPTSAGRAKLGWIDARDVSATAAAALTAPLLHEDLRDDYILTGPRALSYDEAATVISAGSSRPVTVNNLTVGELAAYYRAAGLPSRFADVLAATEGDVSTGRYDEVTTAVLDLTTRPPRTFEAFVQEHAAEWTLPNPASD